MIEIKKKSWNKVSINDYYDILSIMEDESRDDNSRNLGVLAILCEVDEDEIWNLTLPQVRSLMSELDWLKSFDFDRKFNSKHIKIDKDEYDVCVDLQKMTIAQYIDFQTFWGKKDLRTYYGNVLACFITPKGKKYGEDYDVAELGQHLMENLSISMANAVCFFFLKELQISIRAMQVYLEWTMKRLKRKAPTTEIVSQITEIERQLATLKSNMGGLV